MFENTGWRRAEKGRQVDGGRSRLSWEEEEPGNGRDLEEG